MLSGRRAGNAGVAPKLPDTLRNPKIRTVRRRCGRRYIRPCSIKASEIIDFCSVHRRRRKFERSGKIAEEMCSNRLLPSSSPSWELPYPRPQIHNTKTQLWVAQFYIQKFHTTTEPKSACFSFAEEYVLAPVTCATNLGPLPPSPPPPRWSLLLSISRT